MKDRHKMILSVLGSIIIIAIVIFVSMSDLRSESIEQNRTSKKKVLFLAKSTDSQFWKSVKAGANAAASEYNLDMYFAGPDNEEDFEKQNEIIHKAIENEMDAIVFSAVDYNANASAIDRAARRGLKIVAVDSEVNSDRVECYIGTDNYEAGCIAGKNALSLKEEHIKIGIVNFDSKTENGQTREKGFRDTVIKDDRVEIIDSINVNSSVKDAKDGTLKMMDTYPDINLIVTFNEWTSLGVGEAVEQLRLGEKTQVIAFDSNVRSVGMLERGVVDALIVQNPYAMGYLGMEMAGRILNGQEPEQKIISTSGTLITRENMYEKESQRVLFPFDEK